LRGLVGVTEVALADLFGGGDPADAGAGGDYFGEGVDADDAAGCVEGEEGGDEAGEEFGVGGWRAGGWRGRPGVGLHLEKVVGLLCVSNADDEVGFAAILGDQKLTSSSIRRRSCFSATA